MSARYVNSREIDKVITIQYTDASFVLSGKWEETTNDIFNKGHQIGCFTKKLCQFECHRKDV